MKRTSTTLGTLAGIAMLTLLLGSASAQSPSLHPSLTTPAAIPPAAPLAFEMADVHASTRTKATAMSGGWLDGDRYTVHHATMVDLISKAYGLPIRKILGGPYWLDKDRYDITAKAPADTSDDDIKVMLRTLLAERFKVAAHNEERLLPAYLITAPDGGSRMKPSAGGSGTAGCKSVQQPNRPAGAPVTFSCHAESMAAFTDFFAEIMANPTTPEIDATGLKGQWDFTFKALYPPRTADDTAHNFDAIESWLGLKVEPHTAPLPVLIVDSANETPTPNPPGIADILPPPPPAEFAFATIKPSSPDTSDLTGHVGGGQIDLSGVTMQFLLNLAFDLSDQKIANPPAWLDQAKFDIVAKVAPPVATHGSRSAAPFDDEDLPQMLKKLLEDRFGLKWHVEARPADTYVLLAMNPRMKTADPLYHSGCKEGPGPDGKDPRIATPVRGRLISCQNMTMAQLAEELPKRSTGYIKIPMFDSTGLGSTAYDLVLSFSGYSQVGGYNEWSLKPPPAGDAAEHLVAPAGGLLLFDAMQQQLGVKVEKQKRPIPMLVIDHISELPREH